MECKRLNRMIRDWYVQVQDETLAPARMVEFMEDHVEKCDTCFVDPDIHEEIAKITAIVLPPSKMTKKPKKKQPPMEPTAAALAALEAGVNDVALKDDAAKENIADDDDIADEIEVGEEDEVIDDDEIEVGEEDADVVNDVAVEDAELE